MTDPLAAAVTLRKVRMAQADGGTWAQIAPLLHCPDAKTAKKAVRDLERDLRPYAAAMSAAQQIAERRTPAEGKPG